jgi:competence transcription factor ComK
LIGVLALLDLLKKKEQIIILGIKFKQKKKKVQKYTVLKSPFINKKSREQFKLQTHGTIILFSLSLVDNSFFYLENFIDKSLLFYGNSQYLEIKLVKTYKFL